MPKEFTDTDHKIKRAIGRSINLIQQGHPELIGYINMWKVENSSETTLKNIEEFNKMLIDINSD